MTEAKKAARRNRRRKGKSVESARSVSKKAKKPKAEPQKSYKEGSMTAALEALTDADLEAIGAVESWPVYYPPRK